MCESFNITVKTTAAESPFSNETCERHNGVLSLTLEKVRQSPYLSLETALQCSVLTKNCLSTNQGFSPYQLVFGRLPALPSALCNELPALDKSTFEDIRSVLVGIHTSRYEYLRAESSERLNRALRLKTRGNSTVFQIGDSVFFMRKDEKRCRGPGKLLGLITMYILFASDRLLTVFTKYT